MSNKTKFTKAYQRIYGEYKGKIRTIADVTIFPIYGCRTKTILNFTQEICNYTKEGRELIHKNLQNDTLLIAKILANGNRHKSSELFDNSISLIAGQKGKCYITQQNLEIGNMECHHKKPKSLGGTDEYKNLVWLTYEAHKLVHTKEQEIINKYLKTIKIDEKGMKRLNTLRKQVGNSVI